MAKSARSNRKRQLRSQHRLTLVKTEAFKSKERSQHEAWQKLAEAGAQQRQEAGPDSMEVQEQPSAAPQSEAATLEAELLHKMLNPRKRLGKQRRLAEPNTNSSKHHKKRKQRGAKNPKLHFLR